MKNIIDKINVFLNESNENVKYTRISDLPDYIVELIDDLYKEKINFKFSKGYKQVDAQTKSLFKATNLTFNDLKPDTSNQYVLKKIKPADRTANLLYKIHWYAFYTFLPEDDYTIDEVLDTTVLKYAKVKNNNPKEIFANIKIKNIYNSDITFQFKLESAKTRIIKQLVIFESPDKNKSPDIDRTEREKNELERLYNLNR